LITDFWFDPGLNVINLKAFKATSGPTRNQGKTITNLKFMESSTIYGSTGMCSLKASPAVALKKDPLK
jgi:hypothetical protein